MSKREREENENDNNDNQKTRHTTLLFMQSTRDEYCEPNIFRYDSDDGPLTAEQIKFLSMSTPESRQRGPNSYKGLPGYTYKYDTFDYNIWKLIDFTDPKNHVISNDNPSTLIFLYVD